MSDGDTSHGWMRSCLPELELHRVGRVFPDLEAPVRDDCDWVRYGESNPDLAQRDSS